MSPGQLLKERRQHYGLEQVQLAARAETSQAQISRIERDQVSPTVRTLEKLLELMGDDLVLDARTRPAQYPVQPSLTEEEELFYGSTISETLDVDQKTERSSSD